MRRFADELRSEGFSVDYRIASSMRAGVQQHIAEIKPSVVVATEPNSYAARELVKSLGIQTVQSDQFLCHPDEYSQFMGERRTIKMEDFYR